MWTNPWDMGNGMTSRQRARSLMLWSVPHLLVILVVIALAIVVSPLELTSMAPSVLVLLWNWHKFNQLTGPAKVARFEAWLEESWVAEHDHPDYPEPYEVAETLDWMIEADLRRGDPPRSYGEAVAWIKNQKREQRRAKEIATEIETRKVKVLERQAANTESEIARARRASDNKPWHVDKMELTYQNHPGDIVYRCTHPHREQLDDDEGSEHVERCEWCDVVLVDGKEMLPIGSTRNPRLIDRWDTVVPQYAELGDSCNTGGYEPIQRLIYKEPYRGREFEWVLVIKEADWGRARGPVFTWFDGWQHVGGPLSPVPDVLVRQMNREEQLAEVERILIANAQVPSMMIGDGLAAPARRAYVEQVNPFKRRHT